MQSSGLVRLTVPKRHSVRAAELFLRSKAKWIVQQQAKLKPAESQFPPVEDVATYKKHKSAARKLVREKLEYYNHHYGFNYTGVAIRNQKTRWGSCSENGTLSFNYRIVLLPEPLQDYIIVHELCHLQEMNHSSAFWKLVEQTIPQAKAKAKHMRRLSLT